MSSRLDTVAEVATLHFIDRMDQKEIAERLHMSRSTVSRLVHEALDSGVVEITIKHPLPRESALEDRLLRTLGISHAWVMSGHADIQPSGSDRLGSLGASALSQRLVHDGSLAVCWGRSTRRVIEQLTPAGDKNLRVIQMIGSSGSKNQLTDGVELTRMAAHALQARYELLNAPLVADDVASAASLKNQSAIRHVLDDAQRADVALLGLGSIDRETSALHSSGYLSTEELSLAQSLGAAGDVSGILIDSSGQPISSEFSSRVIGLDVEHIRALPYTLAVAHGAHKVGIIRAAAAGGLISGLVTDEPTAHMLLGRTSGMERK